MKKKMSLYYDDIKDKDLIAFINDQRGSLSKNAYILTVLYGIKNNANYTPLHSIEHDADEQKQVVKNNIKKENKNSFMKNLKKD